MKRFLPRATSRGNTEGERLLASRPTVSRTLAKVKGLFCLRDNSMPGDAVRRTNLYFTSEIHYKEAWIKQNSKIFFKKARQESRDIQ